MCLYRYFADMYVRRGRQLLELWVVPGRVRWVLKWTWIPCRSSQPSATEQLLRSRPPTLSTLPSSSCLTLGMAVSVAAHLLEMSSGSQRKRPFQLSIWTGRLLMERVLRKSRHRLRQEVHLVFSEVVAILFPLIGVQPHSLILLSSLKRTGAQKTKERKRGRCPKEKGVTVPGHHSPRKEQ